jgi:hypothetical protein
MTSQERHDMFAKSFGEENATNINATFEKTLLLKNQQLGMIHWAEKISGIVPEVKRDMLSRIRNMDAVLDPTTEQAFLTDLVSKRLGLNIKPEEARALSALARKTTLLEKTANEDGTFDTKEQRLAYGASKVALENYFNELKLQAKSGTFSRGILSRIYGTVIELPGFLKSAVASFDNSFWGRQGIKALADVKTSKVWARNFLKSWSDLGNQLFAKGKWYKSGDDAVMDSIKADIFSRPNAINGKYNAGKYGLNVFNEEAYPSSLPEKIPLLGRVFKASEIAYSGGAMRLRADMADRLIKMAEANGVNTLDPRESRPIGNLVGSLTGRGTYGKGDVLAKEANVLFFSVKFLKANIDTLLAPAAYVKAKVEEKVKMREEMTPGENFAKKEAAKSTLRIIGTMAFILFLAKLIDPDSVEEDPRSSRFGKIKIFGHWTDITGGMAGLQTLVARLTPSLHEGKWSFWTKNTKGEYTDLLGGGFGMQNAMDVFDSFFQGKLAPIAGIFRDVWKGQMYNGNPTSPWEIAKGQFPIMIQNYDNIVKDPASTFAFGSLLLDGLGFSVSSSIEPNEKSEVVPTGVPIKNADFIKTVSLYAQAFGVDPETAFNRLFSGQKIKRVTNGTIIVERMPLKDSQAIKKKANANTPEMKLDHTVPLELGGSNDPENLKLVPTADWSSYTKVENALGAALKAKLITGSEAQAQIKKFKSIQDAGDRKTYGESLIKKYKKTQSFFQLVKPAYASEGLETMGNMVSEKENVLRATGLKKFFDKVKKIIPGTFGDDFISNISNKYSGSAQDGKVTDKTRGLYKDMLALRETSWTWYKENITRKDEKSLLGFELTTDQYAKELDSRTNVLGETTDTVVAPTQQPKPTVAQVTPTATPPIAATPTEKETMIKKYFDYYDAPFSKYAKQFAENAENHNLDYRIPAVISMLETSGGKNVTRENNPGNVNARQGQTYKDMETGIKALASIIGGREGDEWTAAQKRNASYYQKYRDTITKENPVGDLDILAKIYEPANPDYPRQLKWGVENFEKMIKDWEENSQ